MGLSDLHQCKNHVNPVYLSSVTDLQHNHHRANATKDINGLLDKDSCLSRNSMRNSMKNVDTDDTYR